MKPVAAVVGGVRADAKALRDAQELGTLLVDHGFRVVTGGLGGVMRAASEGARKSHAYRDGDVLGVLPTYGPGGANEFVDIPICTGLNHARNLVVVATARIVFAIGGGAGTLSEIAFAWQLGRPVIAVGDGDGWAALVAGRALDDRREDVVHGPVDPAAAVSMAQRLLLRATDADEF